MTQETLIHNPIEQELHHPYSHRCGQLRAAQQPSKQAGGVCDVVICVGADNDAVELFVCHAGWTGVQLEMEY